MTSIKIEINEYYLLDTYLNVYGICCHILRFRAFTRNWLSIRLKSLVLSIIIFLACSINNFDFGYYFQLIKSNQTILFILK